MLRDALVAFRDMIAAPTIQKDCSGPRSTTYVDLKTGQHYVVPLPRPAVTRTLTSLQSFKDACDHFGVAQVWISDTRIVGISADEYECDRLTLPLTLNQSIEYLHQWQWRTPKDLQQFLKVDLFGVQKLPTDIAEQLQQLKFETLSEENATAKHNDNAVSRTVKAKVTGSAALPDEVIISAEVFPGLLSDIDALAPQTIQCAILTDAAKGLVAIRPYPGQIDDAIRNAIADIRKTFDNVSYSVYDGTL